jgi:hypothetical protein
MDQAVAQMLDRVNNEQATNDQGPFGRVVAYGAAAIAGAAIVGGRRGRRIPPMPSHESLDRWDRHSADDK